MSVAAPATCGFGWIVLAATYRWRWRVITRAKEPLSFTATVYLRFLKRRATCASSTRATAEFIPRGPSKQAYRNRFRQKPGPLKSFLPAIKSFGLLLHQSTVRTIHSQVSLDLRATYDSASR